MTESESHGFRIRQILSFIRGVLITYAFLLFLEEKKRTTISVCAFILLCFHAVISVAGGARMYVFLPLVAYFIRNVRQGPLHTVAIFKKLLIVGLVVMAAIPLLYVIERSRQRASGSIDIVASAAKVDAKTAMVMLVTKLDSFSTGRLLVENAGAGTAGYRPYIGSALVFIPRAFIPSRPVAGSVDGTYAGTPPRLVPRTEGIFSDALNVGVSPVHIAIWHFGYVAGGLYFVFAGAAYLIILNRLLLSEKTSTRVLGVYMLAIPSFAGVFVSPDTVVRNTVIISGAAVLIGLLKATHLTMKKAAYMVSGSYAGSPSLSGGQ